MFEYKYYLDATLFDGQDDPIKDIEEFEEVIERDLDKRGFITKYPSRLKFTGSAYDYIKGIRDTDTFCGYINFKLLLGRENGSFTEYQLGVIYISTSVFNLNECFVDCEIVDNSFFAKILNNFSCEAMLTSGLSKNGVAITPCTFKEVTMFRPSTNGAIATNKWGVDVYDALKYLVQFMTDGEVTFQSDWFEDNALETSWYDGLGDNGMLLINGQALRDTTGSTSLAEVWITFDKLYKTISKLVNLWFYVIRNSDGTYTMKAERYPTFQTDDVIAYYRYTQDLELSFDNTNLYATVDVGSSTNNVSFGSSTDPAIDAADYMIYIPAITFYPETYNIEGQCNNANNLSLKSEIVIDHNLITYQVLDATDQNNYDDYHYIVTYDNSTSAPYNAIQYDTFATGVAYYNRYLMNDWVLRMTDFHGEVRKNVSSTDVKFNVDVTSNLYQYSDVSPIPPTIVQTIPFNHEAADPGNDYDNTTYRWTCPANGYYSFSLKVVLNISVFKQYNNPAHDVNEQTIIGHLFNILITPNIADGIVLELLKNLTEGIYTYNVSFGRFYNAGDIEFLDLSLSDTSVLPTYYQFDFSLNTSQWVMDYAYNGGILKPNDREQILINKFSFNSNIPHDEWLTIREQSNKAFNLYITDTEIVKSWNKQIKRNVLTGNTQVELLTNNLNY